MSVKIAIILMLVAFVVTTIVYPYVLSFARKHGIVDNPSARKLQRVPVPVMGGAAVAIGIVVAYLVGFVLYQNPLRLVALSLLLVAFFVGMWDDIKDISPAFRFLVETLIIWAMMYVLGMQINDFHGLWGINEIPEMISIPLTLFAGVGIINAVNLIDGVDGYCSSYGIMSCLIFALLFYFARVRLIFNLTLVFAGAFFPFFLHNVFGVRSKMFLGDGGSLMLGTLLSMCVLYTLSSGRSCAVLEDHGMSLVAFTLAILAVPVFDTVRVMSVRIIRGKSPFHPDKTHLHHLFIEMGFSHLATSAIIVSFNFLVVLAEIIAWKLGASIDLQVYLVIGLSMLFTFGFYFFMEGQRKHETALWEKACRWGESTHRTHSPVWQFIRRLVDSPLLGGKSSGPKVTPVEEKPRIDPRV